MIDDVFKPLNPIIGLCIELLCFVRKLTNYNYNLFIDKLTSIYLLSNQ